MNSRFITYPSTVDRGENHTVVLIDATQKDINELAVFLANSQQDFDVYIYEGQLHDLEHLNHITKSADWVLISEDSQVKITGLDEQSQFGSSQNIQYPVEYFEQIQQRTIDKATENAV